MRPLSVLLAVLLPACGGGGGDDDTAPPPDGGVPPADAGPCTDPASVLPIGWVPVAAVSAGQVASMSAGASTTTFVDATAGGFGMSDNEPFVYVSFQGGTATKVDLDDPTSFTSVEWDLALKRYVIRANGGDSGPGGVAVAKVSGTDLGAVTAPPPVAQFKVDDWTDANCMVVTDDLGAPLTAVGAWYMAVGGMLEPLNFIYVVQLRDGSDIKLRIATYYGDGADPMRSAYFQLEWAPL